MDAQSQIAQLEKEYDGLNDDQHHSHRRKTQIMRELAQLRRTVRKPVKPVSREAGKSLFARMRDTVSGAPAYAAESIVDRLLE